MPVNEFDLIRIGAVQFGQFEIRQQGQPSNGASFTRTFKPLQINLRLLPSYPDLLRGLSEQLAVLARQSGATHLLPTPAAVPLGTAVSLISGMPLVYPAPDDPTAIEGAFDYDVPTVLLTDVLTDGKQENALAKRVKGDGLFVHSILAVINLEIVQPNVLPVQSWRSIRAFLSDDLVAQNTVLTPSLRTTILTWLAAQNPK